MLWWRRVHQFAGVPFEGNPAAVMPLPHWPDDAARHQVAEENNLSETAFVNTDLLAAAAAPDPQHPTYHLRRFPPAIEVDLRGHATLAATSHLLEDVHPQAQLVPFRTRSGWRSVRRDRAGGCTVHAVVAENRALLTGTATIPD